MKIFDLLLELLVAWTQKYTEYTEYTAPFHVFTSRNQHKNCLYVANKEAIALLILTKRYKKYVF